MLEFRFQTEAKYGRTAPQIRCEQTVVVVPEAQGIIKLPVQSKQSLIIDFFSKTESDTVVDNGKIVADTEFRFDCVWCDGIKLEPWFINESIYTPRYFTGFLSQFPDVPNQIVGAYQFNFPGTIEWHWQGDFWDWYFEQRNNRRVINFLDKDPDRVWKFNGSLDPCQDLVQKIREIIQ